MAMAHRLVLQCGLLGLLTFLMAACVIESTLTATPGPNSTATFAPTATEEPIASAATQPSTWVIVTKDRPLHEAVLTGEVDNVEEVIRIGADVNATAAVLTQEGIELGSETPLHLAARFNESPVVIQALLDAGANTEARDSEGWTPLHYAAGQNESPAVIQALVDAGANIEATGADGQTPLHAAGRNSLAVIQVLLDAKGNIEARTDDGWTPLHIAVGRNESPAVIQVLVDAGANIEARTDEGRTPCTLQRVRTNHLG